MHLEALPMDDDLVEVCPQTSRGEYEETYVNDINNRGSAQQSKTRLLLVNLIRHCYLAGIVPSDSFLKDASVWKRTLYHLYQMITDIALLSILATQITAMYRYWGDTVIMLETIGNSAASMLAVWASIFPTIFGHRILKAVEALENESVLTSPVLERNARLKAIRDRMHKKLDIVIIVVRISIVFAMTFWVTSPFVIRYLEGDQQACDVLPNRTLSARELLRIDGYDQFCFVMWVPLDARAWYAQILVYQLFCYLLAFKGLVTLSPLIVYLYVATATEFEIIGALVQVSDDVGKEEDVELQEADSLAIEAAFRRNGDPKDNAALMLKAVIKLHQHALSAADEMNAIQGWCISGALGSVMTMIIVSMYEITVVPSLTPKFALIIIAGFLQIFIFSFFGECIYDESEKVGTIAYNSRWYERSAEYRQMVYMVLLRSQKPICWDVIRVIDVRIVAFSDITSVCYRIFMLLLQFETEIHENTCSQ